MKKIFLLLIMAASFATNAQTGADNRTYPLTELTQKPTLLSGESFETYFTKNFRPEKPLAAGTDISFMIEKVGIAHNITVFKSDDPKVKIEAERVLKAAGKWKIGMKDAKAVRVLYRFKYEPKK